jgi:hypothetical protein
VALVKRKRSARSDRLKKQIEDLRRIAFGAPEPSPFPETDYLEIERESIVRARVLLDCAMIEEVTAIIIMDHVLTDSPKWSQTEYFGRIKRYRVLYDDVLGRLPARHKLTVAKKFIRIPNSTSVTIQRMLALRDIFAHVRTLDYSRRRDLEYKGSDILTEAGFRSYMKDSSGAIAFLIGKSSILGRPKRQPSGDFVAGRSAAAKGKGGDTAPVGLGKEG